MLGTLPGAEEPEQDLEGKQAQRGDRSTGSLEGSAPGPPRDAGALQPDMTLGSLHSPSAPWEGPRISRPPLLCRETLLLPGVPPLTSLVADGRLYLHLITPKGSP